jgi:hypothetical protein
MKGIRHINPHLTEEEYLKLVYAKSMLQTVGGKKMTWEDYLLWSKDMVSLIVQKAVDKAIEEGIQFLNEECKEEMRREVRGCIDEKLRLR